MASKRGGLEVLRETFSADSLTKELVQRVRQRGIDIAYTWLTKRAQMGDTNVVIQVDGGTGRQIESWKKRIKLSWGGNEQLAQIVKFIHDAVVQATPRDTGRLQESWMWMYNGRPLFGGVSEALKVAATFGSKDALRLVNLQPYIRKADRWYVKRGITGPVARRAKARFKGFAIIDSWIEIPGHVISKGLRPTAGRQGGWTGKKGSRIWKSAAEKVDQRIPTILIMRSKKQVNIGD